MLNHSGWTIKIIWVHHQPTSPPCKQSVFCQPLLTGPPLSLDLVDRVSMERLDRLRRCSRGDFTMAAMAVLGAGVWARKTGGNGPRVSEHLAFLWMVVLEEWTSWLYSQMDLGVRYLQTNPSESKLFPSKSFKTLGAWRSLESVMVVGKLTDERRLKSSGTIGIRDSCWGAPIFFGKMRSWILNHHSRRKVLDTFHSTKMHGKFDKAGWR